MPRLQNRKLDTLPGHGTGEKHLPCAICQTDDLQSLRCHSCAQDVCLRCMVTEEGCCFYCLDTFPVSPCSNYQPSPLSLGSLPVSFGMPQLDQDKIAMLYDKLPVPPPPADEQMDSVQKGTDRKHIQKQSRRSRWSDESDLISKPDSHELAYGQPVWASGEQPESQVVDNMALARGDEDVNPEGATTMMITNIPCRFGHQPIVDAIHSVGFAGKYDFVHIPRRNSTHDGNIGYAFVNFKDAQEAEAFQAAFHNYQFSGSKSNKRCEVKLAHFQGFNPQANKNGEDRPSHHRRSRRA